MVQRLKVLLIDDNPSDRALERRLIEKEIENAEVIEIKGRDALLDAIEKGDYDIVVTDYQLMWSNGLEVLRMVRARNPDRPVVMVTATGSEEVAVEAMKSGLNDYIIKSSMHIKKLPVAVMSVLSSASAKRCSIDTEARMERILGLLNVGVFKADINGAISSANEQYYRIMARGNGNTVQRNIFDSLLDIEGRPLSKDAKKDTDQDGMVCMLGPKDRPRWVRMRIAGLDGEGERSLSGLLEDITDFIEMEIQRDKAMERVEENVRQFSALSDKIRNPVSVLYSLAQGLDERKSRMAKEEMQRIMEVLESLDKGWVDTHHMLRKWQDMYR
ncbi:MAG: response regulator [Euryarchaeota archaeon]|nr:response regulator [Euryarchaeota archaeon]